MSAHTQPGKPSEPIPINTTSLHSRTGRARSVSVSSGSSASTSSSTEPPTPLSASATQLPRIGIPSPGSSPILSYFLQSPTKTPGTATFPFKRKFGTAPVFEEDEEKEVPAAAHARRASTAVAGRFAQPQPQMAPLPDQHLERGAGLLRRLSLSSAAFIKPPAGDTRNGAPPSPPPNTAVSPTTKTMPFAREGIKTKPHRSATLGGDAARPRRAPSPMGERILKGHFDGFN